MIQDLLLPFKLNLKNVYGWHSNRKILVLSFDDYGNVRLHSRKVRERLDSKGILIKNRFDAFDALETREDLEMLYETLTGVKDINNRNAVLTAFSVPCNINFEKIINEKLSSYHYELLPETYSKLTSYDTKSYEGSWKLWCEGIDSGIMVPQFHGREHLNVKIFEEKLRINDPELLTILKNRSYTSISNSGYPSINYTAAFDFWDFKENYVFEDIIESGIQSFLIVFGKNPVHFNSPGGRENSFLHGSLFKNNIKYIDSPLIKVEHQGKGRYRRVINYTGKRNDLNMITEVRNVVFEPTSNKEIDWVGFAIKQIEAAFKWKKPAIISSHRVNYCGHISQSNRHTGITALRTLIKKAVRKWPDIEFMSSNELGELMADSLN